LRRHRVPHEVIIRKDEGHGFYRARNRQMFFERLEQFLDKHVKNAQPKARPAE
jgi:dipeptidyl aminopeptidase/acylaminoacyl peptidase